MSTEPPLCLFGAGGHGRVVASQLSRISNRVIVFGDAANKGGEIAGLSIKYGAIDEIEREQVIVTIGDNTVRQQIQEAAGNHIAPAIVIEPDKVYSNMIGVGSQVLAGVVINTDAQIGPGTIVNSNAVIEHDCQVGAFCHIAPGAIMGGGASIGDKVLLGSGAVILPGVQVTSGAIIGGGALVARDILHPGRWVGVPARHLDGDNP